MMSFEDQALRLLLFAISAVCAAMVMGCAGPPDGGLVIDVSQRDARVMLNAMRDEPVTLQRPVVVAGGWADPGVIAAGIARRLRRATGDHEQIISVHFFGCYTFESCKAQLVNTVRDAFGSTGDQTIEVDVVAFSMGGIVARYAAMPDDDRDDDGVAASSDGQEPRLKINRLFTISTPHRGANLAHLVPFDPRAVDMRAGSPFLARLDDALVEADYALISYVRSGDMIVGADNAAPPGRSARYVTNAPFSFAHLNAGADRRIIADIARQLRGEPALGVVGNCRTAGGG